MQPEVEKLSGLSRRVDLSVSVADVEKEVREQLKRIARTAKVQGFRPGKAPLSVIERSHGPSVRYDVISTQVGKALDKVLDDAKLRVAGAPNLEPRTEGVGEDVMAFSATFEVYPEIELPELAQLKVTRSTIEVGDDEVQKTLDILRRQRTLFTPVDGRGAQDGDRVIIDFHGTIAGVPFEGGHAHDFALVLGQGRMLPQFEQAIIDLRPGETRIAPVDFPADYHGADVAGKRACFAIDMKEVAEPEVPEVDADFARLLGQADGDVDALLADIRENVGREAQARARARTKTSVMDALAEACTFDLPKALVDDEQARRVAAARQELKDRGVPDADTMTLPDDAFRTEAERRVRLGLLVGELIKTADLKATPEQVRERVEQLAQNYEEPDQVIGYYMSNPERRTEIESLVLEDNVVEHVLGAAQVTDEAVDFDTLMGTR